MPTYEYICTACDHEFEEFQSMSAKSLTKCPECGKAKLQRKIGLGAGILFKGGGFYETDYRSDSYKKAAESEKSSASGGDAAGGNGHVHTDSCGCGKKTKAQCAADNAAPKTDKPETPAQADKPAKKPRAKA